MTAALSWPLQQGLHALLSTDAALVAELGGAHVYDEPPHADDPASPAGPFLVIGDESVAPWFDKTADGARHDVVLTIESRAPGQGQAKRIAGAVSDALASGALALNRGRVVRVQFLAAAARREGERRRVELRYRFVLEDAPAS